MACQFVILLIAEIKWAYSKTHKALTALQQFVR
jgi:hypothetical protein